MDADERSICLYLKACPGQFVSSAEISRRASTRRRSREEPTWAAPVLGRLVEKGLIEADTTGHYRLIKRERKQEERKWLSPQVRKILRESGRKFNVLFEIDEDEDDLFAD
jgi:hypothetical protein